MLISSNVEGFVPSNFEIYDFYDEEMCFAWSENNLVVFPYVKAVATSKLTVIVTPRKIRGLRCFDSRVFILCEPVGVFKLLRTRKLSPLSSSGITNGPTFYEVLVPEDNWLLSLNKSSKNSRQLFQFEATENDGQNLRDLTLSKKNSKFRLRRAINTSEIDEDICLVSSSKRLFQITQNDVHLIYRSDQEISDIVPILCDDKINGVVLVTGNAAILIHATGEKLNFDKVYLDGEIRGITAGSDKSETFIWLAHIDGTRIHYWEKGLIENTFRKTGMEYKRFVAIKNYKSKFLVCLNDASRIVEVEIDFLGLGRHERPEFFRLRPEMLKGTDRIVEEICERSQQLQIWNEKLVDEQDKLRRINLYTNKMKICWKPDLRIERIAGILFARIKFKDVLPIDCRVIVGIKSDRRIFYCNKKIEESETSIDLNLTNQSFDSLTKLRVDLVTLAEESKPWCLLRDATKNPRIEPGTLISGEKRRFYEAKLATLRKMMQDGNLDMKKLTAMKKSIRREV